MTVRRSISHSTPFILALLLVSLPCHAFEQFVNYRSVIGVNDVAVTADRLYIASSGGLYIYDRAAGTGRLFTDHRDFPDLQLTALYLDKNGTLWAGSKNGYLTRRSPSGATSVVTGYAVSGWEIRHIIPYGKYLIITSSKGCSVFDPQKMAALKNATRFNTFNSAQVNAAAVLHDTLFLGMNEGIASLAIGGTKLDSVNLFDYTVWNVKPTSVAVLSLPVINDSVQPGFRLSALFGDSLVSTLDTGMLYDGNTQVNTFASVVRCIVPEGNKACWIGTSEDYLQKWDGTKIDSIVIPGPIFNTQPMRVWVDKRGTTWCIPQNPFADRWWKNISSFDGKQWNGYTVRNTPGLLGLGLGLGFNVPPFGISNDVLGNMWFGLAAGEAKHYNLTTGEWSTYCIGANGEPENSPNPGSEQFGKSPPYGMGWGICDAITSDSSGYLWLACWHNIYGSLICYDPRFEADPTQTDPVNAHYRRFFPKDDPNHIAINQSLFTDAKGRIIWSSHDGKLAVIQHHGNPIRDSIDSIKWLATKNIGLFYSYAATPDGKTWMATSNGVFKLNDSLQLDTVQNLTMDSRGISFEDSQKLWIATAANGLIRYDAGDKKIEHFTTDNGLVSNVVNDVFVDRTKGYVWAATAEGVSRIDLGYASVAIADGTALTAFPVPFSLSSTGNRDIVFRNLPPSSTVSIYSGGGSLVGTATPTTATGTYGLTSSWRPRAGTVPGPYYYVVSSKQGKARGKLLLVP